MSERYGTCKSCLGSGNCRFDPTLECGGCGGTGFSGDAMDYFYPWTAFRVKRKRTTDVFKKGTRAYESAMEAAVRAATSFPHRKQRNK